MCKRTSFLPKFGFYVISNLKRNLTAILQIKDNNPA